MVFYCLLLTTFLEKEKKSAMTKQVWWWIRKWPSYLSMQGHKKCKILLLHAQCCYSKLTKHPKDLSHNSYFKTSITAINVLPNNSIRNKNMHKEVRIFTALLQVQRQKSRAVRPAARSGGWAANRLQVGALPPDLQESICDSSALTAEESVRFRKAHRSLFLLINII